MAAQEGSGPGPGTGRGADAAPRPLPAASRHEQTWLRNQQLALISWAVVANDANTYRCSWENRVLLVKAVPAFNEMSSTRLRTLVSNVSAFALSLGSN